VDEGDWGLGLGTWDLGFLRILADFNTVRELQGADLAEKYKIAQIIFSNPEGVKFY